MSTVRKHVARHTHVASDIIGDVASAQRGGVSANVDWMSVPYIKLLGNAFFEDLTQLECACPTYDWATLEPYLWGWSSEYVWTPSSHVLPLNDAYLAFKDTATGNYMVIQSIFSAMDPTNLMLYISQSLLVKKDISAGGMVTSNQGALVLGSGFNVESEMPQIILSHYGAGYGTKNILQINNADGYVSGGVYHAPTLANLKVSKIYVDYLKKVNGDDWDLGAWNGGTVTNGIIAPSIVVNSGTYPECAFIGVGSSPVAGRIVWGDGSGWQLKFGYGASGNPFGTITDTVIFTDTGNLTLAGAVTTTDANISNNAHVSGMIESKEYWQHLNASDFMNALNNHTFTDTTGYILFADLNSPYYSLKLHGSLLMGTDTNPTLVCSQNLAVEKDLILKGMIDSLEGELVLNGGAYAPGWGPASKNPFIWLAQGGIYGSYNTLEIRISGASAWDWGNLQCGILTPTSIDCSGIVHGGGGSGNAFLIGDDCYLVDINTANRIGIQGVADATQGGVRFGSNGPWLYRDYAYLRTDTGFVCNGYLVAGTLANTTTTGPLYVNSSHEIGYNGSSIRYKENVEDLPDCSWIYDLRPVSFDWKDANRQKEEGGGIGLIAEEVNEVYPKLVSLNKDGLPESVHYEWLGIPLLVEVKKLRDRVETLDQNEEKQVQNEEILLQLMTELDDLRNQLGLTPV